MGSAWHPCLCKEDQTAQPLMIICLQHCNQATDACRQRRGLQPIAAPGSSCSCVPAKLQGRWRQPCQIPAHIYKQHTPTASPHMPTQPSQDLPTLPLGPTTRHNASRQGPLRTSLSMLLHCKADLLLSAHLLRNTPLPLPMQHQLLLPHSPRQHHLLQPQLSKELLPCLAVLLHRLAAQ